MKTTNSLLLAACLALPLVTACSQEEEAATETAAAPVPVPTTNDDEAWATYLQDVVRRNLGDIRNAPYLYYLPAAGSPGYEGAVERLGDQMTTDLMRGIVEGNLIAYGSPESAKMADLVVKSFTEAEVAPDAMKGVRVLFIGAPADAERVKTAIAPTGASFEFIEAK
jgi:hypothetical protein